MLSLHRCSTDPFINSARAHATSISLRTFAMLQRLVRCETLRHFKMRDVPVLLVPAKALPQFDMSPSPSCIVLWLPNPHKCMQCAELVQQVLQPCFVHLICGFA